MPASESAATGHQASLVHPSAASLPALDELLDGLRVVSLPMNTRFRGLTVREAALLHGPNGWGEFSPFLEYETAEASAWLASAIDDGWGPATPVLRERIAINATLPAVPPEQVPVVLERFGDLDALHTIKVKVAEAGQALEDDRARLRAVRELVGDSVRVRIDANAHWSLSEAHAALTQLAAFDLEYAEQPVAEVEDLARLRELLSTSGVPVPIAADESIRKAEDPLRVAQLGAADVIIVKAQPLGGIRRACEVVAASGLPAVVSSALDTAVGIALGARLAAALPSLDHACGLGTGAFFDHDVARATAVDHASLAVRPVRVTPDPDRLDQLDAGTSRTGWWRERITACHRHLVRTSGADA
ncbi:o-succinylbenzoate synthase [Pseudoclavibacter soli]|uniref:o-succinylbenzoate synthase n=1 Tax=Pseudoclavibacter soli TaxID=452623 RepID=UPI00041BBFF2|nr:o-succinylbenzoate synthase [Pseudoclavibacter soli]